MTQMTQGGSVPTWDLGDRLGKALRVAGVSVHEMAEYLGVSRNTVSNYTSCRVTPDRRTRMLWALRTGVSLAWLETGKEPPAPDGSRPPAWAPWDSNPQPTDYVHTLGAVA